METDKRKIIIELVIILILLILMCLIPDVKEVFNGERDRLKQLETLKNTTIPEWINVDIIEVDGHSRREKSVDEVNAIVVHYVGNPSSTAKQNRDYFNSKEAKVSSHFVVGLDGEIIQCLPLYEISAASNWRNHDTISIEVCHPDTTGKFNEKTYNSLVKLTAWLVELCELDEDGIIRHYDVTGKECPRYYVRNPKAWNDFKTDVMNKVKLNKGV
ncbi:MAG: N-acetylmuramoyl-L-alanine amidase [Clostridia bacterium]|nr:N-acetylmuramoyl-L-alanine amidase [Clostridia bacterium]